jgi:hypothetical protein
MITTQLLSTDEYLFSSGIDGKIRKWHWQSGLQKAEISVGNKGVIRGMAWTEQYLICGLENNLLFWREQDTNLPATKSMHGIIQELKTDCNTLALVSQIGDKCLVEFWELAVLLYHITGSKS